MSPDPGLFRVIEAPIDDPRWLDRLITVAERAERPAWAAAIEHPRGSGSWAVGIVIAAIDHPRAADVLVHLSRARALSIARALRARHHEAGATTGGRRALARLAAELETAEALASLRNATPPSEEIAR